MSSEEEEQSNFPEGTPHQSPKLTPEQINSFMQIMQSDFDIKKTELDVRFHEVELEKSKQSNSHEYAMAALSIQDKAYSFHETCENKKDHRRFWIIIFIFIFLLGVFAMFIFSDNIVHLLEIAKLIVPALIGAVSGYYVGLAKGKASTSNEIEDAIIEES